MDHQDLQMAANTLKLYLNVLSVELNVPQWTHISPDTRLKDHTCAVCNVISEKNEFTRELFILHTENHFQLFIPKNSLLAENLGYQSISLEVLPSSSTAEQNKVQKNNDVTEQGKKVNTKDLIEKLTIENQMLKNENISMKQKLLNQYYCEKCENISKTEMQLQEHIRNQHPETPQHPCEKCGNVSKTKTQLNEHMRIQHPETPQQEPRRTNDIFKCNQCTNLFSTKLLLEDHMRNKHTVHPEPFNHPQLAYTSYNLYKGSSEPPLPLLDNKWNKVQGSKLKPKTHEDNIQTQNVSKNPFRFSNVNNCEYCDEVFDSEIELTEHVNKDHSNTIMEHEESEYINEHEDGQQKENSSNHFKCQICGVVQNTKRKLERHLENHDEEGDWICGCKFQTNDYFLLKRHLQQFKTHQTQLQMRSELQPPITNTKSPIINATSQELNCAQSEESHQCTKCDLAFRTRNNLNKHMKEEHWSHKPCKNFQENNCDFDSDCMFNHIKIAKNEHICFKCGTIFNSLHEMMKHIKEVHPTPCYKNRTGKCTFGSKCIFSHIRVNHDQDFQMSQPTPAPPEWPTVNHKNLIAQEQGNQNLNTMMNQMMKLMNQMDQMMAKMSHTQQ